VREEEPGWKARSLRREWGVAPHGSASGSAHEHPSYRFFKSGIPGSCVAGLAQCRMQGRKDAARHVDVKVRDVASGKPTQRELRFVETELRGSWLLAGVTPGRDSKIARVESGATVSWG
jgi:hypothetical protein